MSEYTVLPLLNSAFKPGTAVEVVERFEDSDFRNIARAELFYFSGRAKECCEIAESYLEDEAIELRLSACILYGYRIFLLVIRLRRGVVWRGFRSV